MHRLFLLFIGLLPALNSGAQSFDEFSLDKEVLIFVKSTFDDMKNFNLGVKCPEEENQWYLDSLDFSPWHVGDFNQDDIPDLFITGQEKKDQAHYLILGKDELDTETGFSLIPVYPNKIRGNLVVPFIEETRNGPLIVFRHFKTETTTQVKDGIEVRLPKTYNDYYKLGLIKRDTLVFKFDGMLEYNPRPGSKPIRFVQIHSFCQFGGCPDFRMKIDSSGYMLLSNIKNTDEAAGLYSAQCDTGQTKLILELANYLRIQKASQRFGEESADRTMTAIISFQDGSAITWYDYEQGATLGISRLYDLLLQAKKSAIWEYRQELSE